MEAGSFSSIVIMVSFEDDKIPLSDSIVNLINPSEELTDKINVSFIVIIPVS
jgi:hypothetical protein